MSKDIKKLQKKIDKIKPKKHVHIFKPRIAVDFFGNDTFWGECDCGEKDA